MDSLITAAARALASGDALGALNHIALRDDPPALAMRGVAMAQLGDLARAKTLLRRAAQAFGQREAIGRARCILAEAEIALVLRDLGDSTKRLDLARTVLEKHGDHANAAHARYLQARYLLLVGRLDEAEHVTECFDSAPLAVTSQAAMELVVAGVSMRRLRIKEARAALMRAARVARQARIASLVAEVESATRVLDLPAARLIAHGKERLLRLDEIESLMASKTLVVDACRRVVRCKGRVISLETRPVLFALTRVLAEAWPRDVPRTALLARAFRAKCADDSHRARLRVEIGRLRKAMRDVVSIEATKDGFSLTLHGVSDVAVLVPSEDDPHAQVRALLADGEAWSSSALALAIGVSARTMQRALGDLTAESKVQPVGRGRARRWMAPPVPGFPTILLLPAALPDG